ncbi:MAG: hypothetical protein ACI4HQ_04330 [Acetatifactor sp.]
MDYQKYILNMLIAEFDTFRDTRYSAYVIDVLKRPTSKTAFSSSFMRNESI